MKEKDDKTTIKTDLTLQSVYFHLNRSRYPTFKPTEDKFSPRNFLTCTFIIFHKPLKPFSEHDAKGNGILQVTMITLKLGLTF